MLVYATRINTVLMKLSDASVAASTAKTGFNWDGEFYDGRAAAEIRTFFDSYLAHLDKLVFFESVASQFLVKVFQEITSTDQGLAGEIAAAWLGGQR